ncbi:MAG: energy-coupling factor transporter transmembrane protein EcfT [Salinarimonadaceae bacterium]|nr:MAG: energy-coupling factor transporter transmembrane protein EcfT [Salinarimonadaceae bacterium]
MLGIYHDARSPVHRLPAGAKILVLIVGAALILSESDWSRLAIAGVSVASAFALARIPAGVAVAQIRPALWILGAIFLFHALIGEWRLGALITVRFVIVLALASLVTLTTRVSDMMAAIERALGPLRPLGVKPATVALCLSMAIRFVPVLSNEAAAVREAQRARGLERSLTALASPLILRALRMADSVAEALHARGYDPEGLEPSTTDEPPKGAQRPASD